ncbi:MAG: pyridoxamine 5'-phosphate oxidase [Hyphomicrobiaceae bacterium]
MNISPTEDPLDLFSDWFQDANESEVNDPNAVALATVDEDGMPNVRIVLLKDYDVEGFVFYTNLESAKGREVLATGKSAMCFHWKSRQRQVRIRGTTELVNDEQADEYFNSRPGQSRIGAWASQQSRPMTGRRDLLQAIARFGVKYAVGQIPRPNYWAGVRLKPLSIEFWQAGEFRLHHRIDYRRKGIGCPWEQSILFP